MRSQLLLAIGRPEEVFKWLHFSAGPPSPTSSLLLLFRSRITGRNPTSGRHPSLQIFDGVEDELGRGLHERRTIAATTRVGQELLTQAVQSFDLRGTKESRRRTVRSIELLKYGAFPHSISPLPQPAGESEAAHITQQTELLYNLILSLASPLGPLVPPSELYRELSRRWVGRDS